MPFTPEPGRPVAAAPIRRWRSLERRLPLLLSVGLVVMLGVWLALTYATLADSATDAARIRLANSVRQLAVTSERTIATGLQRLEDSAAAAPELDAVLAGARDAAALAAARQALLALRASGDTALPIELWSDDGRLLLSTIGDHAPDLRPLVEGEAAPVPRPGLGGVDVAAGARVGGFFAYAGETRYWSVAPLYPRDPATGRRLRDRAPLGFVAMEAALGRNAARTGETIRALSGSDVSMYYHNDDGTGWADVQGRPVAAPTRVDSSAVGLSIRRGDGALRYAAERPVSGSRFVLALEVPRASVLARPARTLLTLATAGLVLLLVAVGGVWVFSRRLTRPLVALTGAAEAVAAGDYGIRVHATGDDELARLAASFNRMAADVGTSRAALERQTAQAEAAAHDLERANRALAAAVAEREEREVALRQAVLEAERAGAEAEQARRAAEAANRAKSDFLAVMSHELRTPLNAIGGYAELMELGLRGPLTEEQRRDLARIRTSQQHLLGLISAVLDLSRIEAGRVAYDVSSVALASFLRDLDALVEPQAGTKAIALTVHPVPPGLAALADREKLRQILINLLSNAIRHTPQGGRIDVTAEAVAGGMVAIAVRDTGPGISPEATGRIFEPFVQLDRSLARPVEGVGLGLAISRDLARGMGGELEVASALGAGSTFTVTLPLGDAADRLADRHTGEVPAVAGPAGGEPPAALPTA